MPVGHDSCDRHDRDPCPRPTDRLANRATRGDKSPGTARILVPRMMMGLYDSRNNRGVVHTGAEVEPNKIDATAVLYVAKWLVAELLRLLHTLSTMRPPRPSMV